MVLRYLSQPSVSLHETPRAGETRIFLAALGFGSQTRVNMMVLFSKEHRKNKANSK